MVLREPGPENTGAAAAALERGGSGAGWLCWEGDHIATARQGRDTGILQSPTWGGYSELSGMEY